jgi:hypothetical protein
VAKHSLSAILGLAKGIVRIAVEGVKPLAIESGGKEIQNG